MLAGGLAEQQTGSDELCCCCCLRLDSGGVGWTGRSHLVDLHQLGEGLGPLDGHLDDVCRRRHGCGSEGGGARRGGSSHCLTTPLTDAAAAAAAGGSCNPAGRERRGRELVCLSRQQHHRLILQRFCQRLRSDFHKKPTNHKQTLPRSRETLQDLISNQLNC